jgi:hypothetical protein
MNNNRYQVVFTGKLVAGSDRAFVVSNLVLDVGLSEDKAKSLLLRNRVVLKRFGTHVEARKMAAKLEGAGLICHVEEVLEEASNQETSSGTESSLMAFINKITPVVRKPKEASNIKRR